MKRLIIIVLLSAAALHSQNLPHLFELRGLEDSLGNTHLFYRYGGTNTSCWKKDIYHLDLINNIDTLFISDFGYMGYPGSGCEGIYVYDYEFFNGDPTKFIYGGYNLWIDPLAIIVRYDGEIQIPSFGGITDIEISQQNDSLVYAALGEGLYKSIDGGYNFSINFDSLAWIDNAMISLSKNDDTQIYGVDDSKLVRSEDEGQSYIIVDDDIHWGWNYEKEIYYDADGQHIYGVSTSSTESAFLVSDGNGDPFTWNLKLATPGKIWFTLDEQFSGEVYYSYKKNIYKSTDFGNTFSLYKELDQKVTGLYKKSSTNILYASTLFRIYEITPDSIRIIKSLPIPDEILNYYPLAIGNQWQYRVHYVVNNSNLDTTYYSLFTVERDTVMPNGYQYQVIESDSETKYVHIDSATACVYEYEYDLTRGLKTDSLLCSEGDWFGRDSYCELIDTATILNYKTWIMVIDRPWPDISENHTLAMDIGMVYQEITTTMGFGTNKTSTLVYAKIDGTEFGELVTTVNEVSNEINSFTLHQNYPNPFNPSTTIKFTVAESPIPGGDGRGGLVTLKVYDVLGNEIATLVNEELPAGEYEVEFYIRGLIHQTLPSGIYFYQLKAGHFIETKKMLLLK